MHINQVEFTIFDTETTGVDVFSAEMVGLSFCYEKGKAYYEKKLKEGKTKRHARKCLARQLVKIVFKLLND